MYRLLLLSRWYSFHVPYIGKKKGAKLICGFFRELKLSTTLVNMETPIIINFNLVFATNLSFCGYPIILHNFPSLSKRVGRVRNRLSILAKSIPKIG
jgi:hypothetical protein